MSGTSLDGVDAAMVLTDGERILDFGRSDYRPYTTEESRILRAALGRWPGEPGVEAAAEVIETAHAEVLVGMVDARIIGFHGRITSYNVCYTKLLRIPHDRTAEHLGQHLTRARLMRAARALQPLRIMRERLAVKADDPRIDHAHEHLGMGGP